MRALTDFGKVFFGSWAVVLLLVWMSCSLLGCSHVERSSGLEPVTTTVRRAHSLIDVDIIGDQLGRDGWHVVEIDSPDGGGTWLVVLERRAAR